MATNRQLLFRQWLLRCANREAIETFRIAARNHNLQAHKNRSWMRTQESISKSMQNYDTFSNECCFCGSKIRMLLRRQKVKSKTKNIQLHFLIGISFFFFSSYVDCITKAIGPFDFTYYNTINFLRRWIDFQCEFRSASFFSFLFFPFFCFVFVVVFRPSSYVY